MMKMGAKVILHFSGLCLVSTSYDVPLYHFTENACAYIYVSLSYKILFAKKGKKKWEFYVWFEVATNLKFSAVLLITQVTSW